MNEEIAAPHGRTEIVGIQAEFFARECIERRRFVLHEFAAD